MISFEEFLTDKFNEEGELDGIPVTKDNCETMLEHWFENLDVSELIEYGDEYGKLCFLEGQKVGIVQEGELATSVLIKK